MIISFTFKFKILCKENFIGMQLRSIEQLARELQTQVYFIKQ